MGRPRQGRYPKGDPPHDAYPRGRPVVDDIGTVGDVLLCDGRFGQTAGMGVVHSDEMVGLSRGNTGEGKSEGTNRANPLVHNGFARFSLCQ